MVFFRIDPITPFIVKAPAGTYLAAVVEYADKAKVRRTAIAQTPEGWRILRGALPMGLILSTEAPSSPPGLTAWLDKQFIISKRVFTLPDGWSEVNAHLIKHGAFDG